MEATRCKECGDVRWSFLGFASREPGPCEMCGGEVVPERRKPHRGPLHLHEERRVTADAKPAAATPR